MKRAIFLLLLLPAWLIAQRQQLQELQRDVALLQADIQAMNEKLANITALLEQTLTQVSKIDTAVTVLEGTLREALQKQEKQLATPVASLGTKVDSMADQFRFLQENIADLSNRITRMQTQLTDLRNTIQILSAPPPPPSGPTGTAPGTSAPAATAPATPAASAESLFNNARRDQLGGQYDLALSEFQDFLKLFPNSDLAPAAQFHIGEILYAKGNYKAALQAFDLVLEKYPANEKTPDALLMKAMTLIRLGQKEAAARELRSLLRRYPQSELAERARAELEKLGYPSSTR